MSVVFLPTGEPTVKVEAVHDVAARHDIKLNAGDDGAYCELMNGLDATAKQILSLPAYIEPRLQPDPSTVPRTWHKADSNPLGAWSHRTSIKSLAPGDPRLEGKTVAVKDNVSVAGLPQTGGTFAGLLHSSPEYPIPNVDAIVVKRILESSGSVTGIATCENFSMSPLSFTSATGPVHSPWAKGWTTGGSSSGCAALVGISQVKAWRERHGLPDNDAELGDGVDMAIGGDQGGSIRIPSAYCGIYGLKPTHGLVPYTGILSLHPLIDHAGPMATTLKDITALLSVMAGYDGIDPRMTPETPLHHVVPNYAAQLSSWITSKTKIGEWTASAAGKGLRVGVIKESFEVLGLTPEVTRIVRAAVQRFRDLGADVEEVSIPMHLVGPSIWTIATRIAIARYGLGNSPQPLLNHPMPDIIAPEFDQAAYDLLTKANPAVVNMHFNATYLSEVFPKMNGTTAAALQAKALTHVTELRAAYDTAFSSGKYDVLVTPLNPRVSSRHPHPGMSVQEKMAPAIGAPLNTCQFNVTGHPGLTVPVGFGDVEDNGEKAKLPVAMQLVGKRFGEEEIFKAAAAWEVGGMGLDSWDGRCV